ncbi:helix-turn-helix domain-containing protein [Hydromonas duriensis]|uniref:Helix-turn-helix protein n=1 Tax=Hydromonas duriensis TaxID=1527608 RepID=A0A4R6Y5R2_9BURK|nr:helix-turn-helix domain-containing protein [Hydromonas duriensis]TDR30662.1 helix-turn-helix protein [Hydromonas duriensis]
MTRNETILSHLKTGQPITNMMATHLYKITSLQEAIRDLRSEGHVIRTHMEHKNGKRYGRYTLQVIAGSDTAQASLL